ncbi:hypothetical protein MMC17_005344 [Xylographa soralifera]|nr:hypothetical protein [Xylographa soralifera]
MNQEQLLQHLSHVHGYQLTEASLKQRLVGKEKTKEKEATRNLGASKKEEKQETESQLTVVNFVKQLHARRHQKSLFQARQYFSPKFAVLVLLLSPPWQLFAKGISPLQSGTSIPLFMQFSQYEKVRHGQFSARGIPPTEPGTSSTQSSKHRKVRHGQFSARGIPPTQPGRSIPPPTQSSKYYRQLRLRALDYEPERGDTNRIGEEGKKEAKDFDGPVSSKL